MSFERVTPVAGEASIQRFVSASLSRRRIGNQTHTRPQRSHFSVRLPRFSADRCIWCLRLRTCLVRMPGSSFSVLSHSLQVRYQFHPVSGGNAQGTQKKRTRRFSSSTKDSDHMSGSNCGRQELVLEVALVEAEPTSVQMVPECWPSASFVGSESGAGKTMC